MAVGRPAGESGQDAEARIAALETALAESNARNAELVEQVSRLVTQIEVLTEQLRQNSKNSHRPPSSDGPGRGSGGAIGGSKKPKSKRNRGGQTGHRGAHRELMAPEAVDDVVDFFPDVCLGCAAELPRVVDGEPCRYQQLDLRDHRPHLTEFRRHAVSCPHCGARTRAAYDATKIPASAFGPCLTAVVGM